MDAGDADPAGHGLGDALELLPADLAHGPIGHDQVQAGELVGVEERIQRVGYFHLEVVLAELAGEDDGHLLRLVAVPAAPADQGLLHCCVSFP